MNVEQESKQIQKEKRKKQEKMRKSEENRAKDGECGKLLGEKSGARGGQNEIRASCRAKVLKSVPMCPR